MIQNKSKTVIFVGFIIIAITLFTFYLLTFSSLKTTVSQSREEQLVLKMMRHLDNLQLYESDIESTERPYIISIDKNKRIVQKFSEAAINYTNELGELRKLSDNDQLPRNEILQLLSLGEKKLSFSKEIIDLSIKGDPKTAIAALFDREDGFDTPFRDQYNKVSNIGRALLRSFQQQHDANAKNTFNLFGWLGLIALMVIGFLYYRIWYRAKLTDELSEDLKNTNITLKNYIKNQDINLFENAKDVIGIVNSKGQILRVNTAVEEMLGYTKKEVESMVLNDFLFEPELQNNPFTTLNIPKEGFLQTVGKYKKKDGSKIYAEVNSSSLPDGTFMAIVRDITDRREKENELRMREYAMAKAISGIGITDMSGTITYANEAIAKMWGADSTAELIGKKLTDCFEGPRVLQTLRSLQTSGFDSGENIGKRKDGSLFDVHFVANVIFDDKGRPFCMFGSFTDITEIKKQREEINNLLAILENSSALIGTMDMNFRVTYMNKASRVAIEVEDDVDLSGLSPLAFFNDKIVSVDETISEVMTKGFWKGENILVTQSGKEIPIMQAVYLHRNEKGEPAFISSNAIDISELKVKENELAKLANIIENSPAYVMIVDLNLNLLYLNKAANVKLGIGEDEDITKLSALDFISAETKEKMQQEQPKLMLERKWVGESKFLNRKGEIIPVYEVAIVHSDKLGVMQYISLTLVDISELKEKENELMNLTSILDNSPAYISMANIKKDLIYVNPAFRKAFGIKHDEDITKLNVSQFRSPETKEIIKNGDDSNLNNGKWVGTNSFVSRSGKDIPVMEVLVVHKNKEGEPERISLTAIDLTEQRRIENELLRANNELRELSIHLQNLIERERSAIAKEIHDEFSQNLAALGMNAAWLRANVEIENTKVQDIIKEQIAIAEEAIESSRNLYNSLHPSMLDEIGLEATIRWQTKTSLRYSDIKTEIHSNIEEERLTKEINLGLFRIFQESLTNVLRYSKATHLSITIHKTDEMISMVIEDNGIGFEINKIDATQSHGLLGIRERVYALNGKSEIESFPGKGTRVEVQIPLFVVEETTLTKNN